MLHCYNQLHHVSAIWIEWNGKSSHRLFYVELSHVLSNFNYATIEIDYVENWVPPLPKTKNWLNYLQLTCRNSKEACGITQTFLQEWFNQALMHSDYANKSTDADRLSLDGSLAGACCMSTAGSWLSFFLQCTGHHSGETCGIVPGPNSLDSRNRGTPISGNSTPKIRKAIFCLAKKLFPGLLGNSGTNPNI